MLILINLLSGEKEGLVKAHSWLSEVIVFSEKLKAPIYISFTSIRNFLQRPLGPQNGSLLAKNIFVVTFWHFFLSKTFVPEILSVDSTLPFICGFKLLLSQGDPKTCIPLYLWTTPPLIVQITQESFSKAILSSQTWDQRHRTKWMGQGVGSGIVFLLCLESFLLPTQKE